MEKNEKKQRDSNIELLRIFMMIVIIAHHYVVNSGISGYINSNSPYYIYNNINTYFAYIFGWGGKTAINVFLLITGYFMCKQEFKWKKFIYLCCEILFYRWVIDLIFIITGYEPFSLKESIKTFLEIPYWFGRSFTSSYLALYVLSPFINKFIMTLDKKNYMKLLVILLIIFTGFSTFCLNSSFEYLGWYITVYLIGAFIRLYPFAWMKDKKKTFVLCFSSIILSWLSVVCICLFSKYLNKHLPQYYFVADSNKVLAIFTAVFLFLFFKNINIGNNKIINTLAASTFGVLMIHASSDVMREWLWKHLFRNVDAFQTSKFMLHAVSTTIIVYFVCVLIDITRKHIARLFVKTVNFKKGKGVE